MKYQILLYIGLALSFITPASAADRPLTLFTVNYPLKYFAERVGRKHVAVHFPAPADEDPAYWMPDIATISAYQRADLILLNGAGYAKWTKKVTLPHSKLVNTSASFKDRYISADEVVTHSHGADGTHAHESLAFTTWLDFSLAADQAHAIYKALSRKKPEGQEFFHKNYTALKKDLMALDAALKRVTAKDPSKPLIVSHPVYDYLAKRYGLNIKSVHWEPDELPSETQWINLRRILKSHPSRWMIWEGKPAAESVQLLKAMGINSLIFDPCGNRPDDGDWLLIMQRNIDTLGRAFR